MYFVGEEIILNYINAAYLHTGRTKLRKMQLIINFFNLIFPHQFESNLCVYGREENVRGHIQD